MLRKDTEIKKYDDTNVLFLLYNWLHTEKLLRVQLIKKLSFIPRSRIFYAWADIITVNCRKLTPIITVILSTSVLLSVLKVFKQKRKSLLDRLPQFLNATLLLATVPISSTEVSFWTTKCANGSTITISRPNTPLFLIRSIELVK